MAQPVAQLDDDPEPSPASSRRPRRTDRNEVAPEPKRDEGGVEDGESDRVIAADEATGEAGYGEDLVERERVLLDGVAGLYSDEYKEGALGTRIHAAA